MEEHRDGTKYRVPVRDGTSPWVIMLRAIVRRSKDSSFRAPPVGKLGILPGDPTPQPPMSDVVRGYILNLLVNYSSVSCKKVTLLQWSADAWMGVVLEWLYCCFVWA